MKTKLTIVAGVVAGVVATALMGCAEQTESKDDTAQPATQAAETATTEASHSAGAKQS